MGKYDRGWSNILAKTRWQVAPTDLLKVQQYREHYDLHSLLAKVCVARKFNHHQVDSYLTGAMIFHDPFLLNGMQLAVSRIQQAIRSRQQILIYGDYDVDGVSATALMVRLLQHLEAKFEYRIPHRQNEGYGLHPHVIEQAHQQGISLIITVDTGISAYAEAALARRLGMDLIITDHHEPPEQLPDAYVILNPKSADCHYPFRELSGSGVAFKLAHALLGRLPEQFICYAALGTIADVMPLIQENHSIVKLGLEQIRSAPPIGIAALLEEAGVSRQQLSSQTIGFVIAPRMNAAGRLGGADEAVRLLITDDAVESSQIATRLNILNKERQQLVQSTTNEAIAMIEATGGPSHAIVVSSDQWNSGIIGIVASRLVEKYYVPSLVIALDPLTHVGKGSARSISQLNLFETIKVCADWLEEYGGHDAAAGLSIRREHVDSFATQFNNEVAARLKPEHRQPTLTADATIVISEATVAAIQQLDVLAPFGAAHSLPLFHLHQCQISEWKLVGKEQNHLKLKLTDHTGTLDAMLFRYGDSKLRIAKDDRVSVIGELSINEWNDRQTPQLIVKDIIIGSEETTFHGF
jgi:single-stranded-DNA-specific exonuclease